MVSLRWLPLTLCSAALWGPGCGDDATLAGDGGTESSSTSAPSTSSAAPTTTSTDNTSTSAATATSGSSSSAADSTGTAAGSTDGGATGSSDGSGSGSSGPTGGDATSTGTGGESAACEDGGVNVLSWSIEVIDGQFPDDLPTDLIANCTLGTPAGADQLRVDCPDLQIAVNIDATPAPSLPSRGEALELRFHRAPGPLGFPDLWLQMDFANGTELALAASSVLDPGTETLELPWEMSLSDQDCGPFNIEDPFGNPDACGDQTWLGLNLAVSGQGLTAFHGSFASLANAFGTVEFWVGGARSYGELPEFCDFAPQFFTTLTLSVPEA